MEKLDYKKAQRSLYLPGRSPSLIEVPALPFIMVDGAGDPNAEGGAYQQALSLLYALSFTIKMSRLEKEAPAGYFDYVVPPLEGLWRQAGGGPVDYARKEDFLWTAMIRQPDFVTPLVFAWACERIASKKGLDPSPARLEIYHEGLCVQCMHWGPYDEEPATLDRLAAFMAAQGLTPDDSPTRRHHEIYLSDPRRTQPQRLKTVLRLPVK